MALQIDVDAINLGRRQALLTTGTLISITMIDMHGEHTLDAMEAVSFCTDEIPGIGSLLGDIASFLRITKH